jgi:hypothetical protein
LLFSLESVDSWFFLSFPAELILWNCGSGRDEEPAGKKRPPPDSDSFSDAQFGENYASSSR